MPRTKTTGTPKTRRTPKAAPAVARPPLTLAAIRDRNPIIPLVQSHGMGVDSTAVVCLLVEHGLTPQLIQMADTGDERPETYQYIPIINAFLRKHGLPEVKVVKRKGKYESLSHNCLACDMVASLAYGKKGCSAKWKIEPMNKDCNVWAPAQACWAAGARVIKIIGYDAGDRDKQRFAHSQSKLAKTPDTEYDYWYPLQEFRLDREACKAVIKNAGLPVPPKSCCWHCPAMKVEELRAQYRDHPELVERAVTMEVNAAQGKHGFKTIQGLGRNWSWTERLAQISTRFADAHEDELAVLRSFTNLRSGEWQ